MSKIEWTGETLNLATGCTKISPGCDNCYMYSMYPRLKAMGLKNYQDVPEKIRTFPEQLAKIGKWTTPRMVFVCSMADLFHREIPYEFILEAVLEMDRSAGERGHIFQLLTKRPGRLVEFWRRHNQSFPDGWPPNIWAGVSIETQKYTPRLDVLARVPIPVKFVSAEPLLGPLDLSRWLEEESVQWVIAGGESGRGARPMAIEWAKDLRDQAAEHGVPFFLKQLGGARDKKSGEKAMLDGKRWQQFPENCQQER